MGDWRLCDVPLKFESRVTVLNHSTAFHFQTCISFATRLAFSKTGLEEELDPFNYLFLIQYLLF